MTKEVFKKVADGYKGMPTSLKVAYYLIVLSLALNIYSVVRFCGAKKTGGKSSEFRVWVDENPEAILESVNKYAMKRQEEAQAQQTANAGENIKKYASEIESTKNQGVLNAKGNKIIVEFFDYDCPYCRMAAKNTRELVGKRKDIKVILRPLVIHDSAQKATEFGVAVALLSPEKFVDYYEYLMVDSQGQSGANVEATVKKTGISYSKVEKYVRDNRDKISEIIAESRDLAGKLGINGTPGFVAGGTLIPGAVDTATLERTVDGGN